MLHDYCVTCSRLFDVAGIDGDALIRGCRVSSLCRHTLDRTSTPLKKQPPSCHLTPFLRAVLQPVSAPSIMVCSRCLILDAAFGDPRATWEPRVSHKALARAVQPAWSQCGPKELLRCLYAAGSFDVHDSCAARCCLCSFS